MDRKTKYTDLSLVGNNLDDIDAVVQSIHNLINISINEVMFNRKLGSRLQDLLFNQLTVSNSMLVLSELTYRISQFDPRVTVDKTSTVTINPENREYVCKIVLKILGVERLIPTTFNLKQRMR